MTRPMRTAIAAGTPAMIISDVAIGVSAKVEPTDRSNSPQIIRIVTPIDDHPDLRQEAEDAAQVVGREERLAGAELEHCRQQDQQHDPRQFRLFEINAEQILHRGSLARGFICNADGRRRRPPAIRLLGEGVNAGPAWPATSAHRPAQA